MVGMPILAGTTPTATDGTKARTGLGGGFPVVEVSCGPGCAPVEHTTLASNDPAGEG